MKRIRRAVSSSKALVRVRRQNNVNTLANLGFCFGDLVTKVQEEYPNQKIVVLLQSSRAPSVVLSARNGGNFYNKVL